MICLCSGHNLSSRINDITPGTVTDAITYHNVDAGANVGENNDYDDDGGERLKKCTVSITGMTCGSCVASIERHLQMFKGE